jgi:hypothetical protein
MMAQEVKINSYYESLRRTQFIDSNICCKLAMEFLASSLLYQGDFSRVVYSKEDICFRRRVELVGNGSVEAGTYDYVNLDLPFTCYSQTGNYEPDDRSAAMNAAAAIRGHVQPDSGIIVKFMPVKIEYSMTSFFSRRDDVNVASQLLYWETNPKFPLYYVVHHTLAGQPIDIPVFMSLEQTDMNVEYNEKDWLQKSKIFPLKTKVIVRTYQTLIESIDKKIKLPLRFAGLYGYNEDSNIYFTQNAVLIWADEKFSGSELKKVEESNPNYADQEPPYANEGKLTMMMTADEYRQLFIEFDKVELELGEHKESLEVETDPEKVAELEASIAELEDKVQFLQDEITLSSTATVEEAVKGYFTESTDVVLDYFQVEDVTENTAKLVWKIRETDINDYQYMTVYCPGIINYRIDDVSMSSLPLEDLHPGSTYEVTLVTMSKQSGASTYRVKFITQGAPIHPQKKLSDALVGRTFTGRS